MGRPRPRSRARRPGAGAAAAPAPGGPPTRHRAVPHRPALALARPDRPPEQLESVDPRPRPRRRALPRGRSRGPARGRRPRHRRPRPVSRPRSRPTAAATRATRTGGTVPPAWPEALDLLDRITDGAFAPWTCTPLAELARYPQRMALGDGWYVNVGRRLRPPGSEPALARPAPLGPPPRRPRGAGHAARRRTATSPIAPAAGLGRACSASPTTPGGPPPEADCRSRRSTYLPDAAGAGRPRNGRRRARSDRWRSRAGTTTRTTTTTTSARSSRPSTARRCSIDLGQPTYTALSFSDRRYEQWVVQSDWHNVPLINGQRAVARRALPRDARSTRDGELAEPRPGAGVSRRVALPAGGDAWTDGAITIADEWDGSADAALRHRRYAARPRARPAP